MRHSTTSLACLLFLAGCGGAPDGADPSTPEPTGEISQGSFIVLLNSTDPRWSFQGQFQRDDCRNFWSDDFANDAWPSGYTCPFTTPIPEGRAMMPETGCGGWQYLCEQSAFSFFNSLKFGGMYQVDDCGANTIGNAYNNGATSCTGGFLPRRIGRVKAPESGCGAWQYLCAARTNEPGGHTVTQGIDCGLNTLRWGGQYQKDDCFGDSRVNPLTGSYSCPSPRYFAVQYGRVLGPETGCGVNQFVCVGIEPH